jgi:hypothetical protein
MDRLTAVRVHGDIRKDLRKRLTNFNKRCRTVAKLPPRQPLSVNYRLMYVMPGCAETNDMTYSFMSKVLTEVEDIQESIPEIRMNLWTWVVIGQDMYGHACVIHDSKILDGAWIIDDQ